MCVSRYAFRRRLPDCAPKQQVPSAECPVKAWGVAARTRTSLYRSNHRATDLRQNRDMSNKEDRSDIAIGGRPRRRSSARLALLVVLGVVLLGGSTAVSYYVDALWFESLGFASVFWTRISLQAAAFGAFALVTFLVVYGVFRALNPNSLGQLIGATILVNPRPGTLPLAPAFTLIPLFLSLAIPP